MNRCKWVNLKNELYAKYHDEEWGVPSYDDGYLFEMLVLESFQAGLSWECVLNKRENFRRAFDGFDYKKIACYGDEKVEKLKNDSGIIRNRLKICASIENAKDLLMRGMRFVGSTIIYSYLQAIGVIDDHELNCDFRKRKNHM